MDIKIPLSDFLPCGVCRFCDVKDNLIQCRAKSRIPKEAKSIIVYLFPYYLGEESYKKLNEDYKKKYSGDITVVSAIGISGMMHGYLAFDKDDNLFVPFRTWRNTTTEQASDELSERIQFNIPQRWSVSHFY